MAPECECVLNRCHPPHPILTPNTPVEFGFAHRGKSNCQRAAYQSGSDLQISAAETPHTSFYNDAIPLSVACVCYLESDELLFGESIAVDDLHLLDQSTFATLCRTWRKTEIRLKHFIFILLSHPRWFKHTGKEPRSRGTCRHLNHAN